MLDLTVPSTHITYTRWFTVLARCIIERLSDHGLKLDIHGRHAADTDDVCFSLATVCLFAASYASSPLHQTPSESSLVSTAAAKTHHPFSLLLVLGSAAAGVAGAVVIHALVGLAKRPPGWITSWRRKKRKGGGSADPVAANSVLPLLPAAIGNKRIH